MKISHLMAGYIIGCITGALAYFVASEISGLATLFILAVITVLVYVTGD